MPTFQSEDLTRLQEKLAGPSTGQFAFRAENQIRNTELYQRMSGGELPDVSASGAFFKQFEKAKGFTKATSNYLATKGSGVDPDSYMADFGNYLWGKIGYRDQNTGELSLPYFLTAEEAFGSDWKRLNEDERRERIKAFDAKLSNMYYGNVAAESSPIAGTVGTVTGYMADPTTLTPIGHTKKAAAIIGGTLGGSDIAMAQLAEEGKVTMEDVALGAAVGAGLGIAIKVGGDAFANWLKGKIKKGEPIDPDDLMEAVDSRNQPNTPGGGPGSALTEKIFEGEFIPGERFSRAQAEDLATKINERFQLTGPGYMNHWEKVTNSVLDKPKPRLGADRSLFELRLAAATQDDITDEAANKLSNLDKNYKDKYGAGFSRPPNDSDIKFSTGKYLPKLPAPNVDDRATKLLNEGERKLNENFKSYIKNSKQSGEAANWLVRDLAAAGVGGLYGYSQEGDIESAMMWAIAGAGGMHAVGLLGPKLYNAVGKLKPYNRPMDEVTADSWNRKYSAHKWAQRPSEYFKKVAGATGHRFAAMMRRMDEGTRADAAENIIDMKAKLASLGIQKGSPYYKQIVATLRNPKLLKDAPKEVAEATRFIRKQMNKVVDDALNAGVISKKQRDEMVRKALSEGYFPRVYDTRHLMSRAGETDWNRILGAHKWSKKQIDDAAKSIIGVDKYDYVNFKPVRNEKTGEINYTVDKKFIRQLYEKRNRATFTSRSSHLEKDRKITLPDEVLAPFLIDDLESVLSSYFHDTRKRINGAKIFGRNDEEMHRISDEMKALGVSSADINDAWTVYKTSVGDPGSELIRQMMEMTPELRRAYSTASSIQTFNLMLAQILTSTQALANTMIYLPSRVGIRDTGKLLYRGMKNYFDRENREWSERIGAAFETTILEVAGELGSMESRAANKFLEYTGFTLAEKIQRQLGANIGKAYLEEIIENQNRLLAKQAKGKLGKDGLAKMRKIEKQFEEFGFDPAHWKDPNRIPTRDMDLAAQRYSNIINFVNTPDQLPLWWQNPHSKMFRQFKTFMFHQGAMLNDNLIKPAKQGNVKPLLGLAAASGLGVGTSEMRKWIKADDEDYTMMERYLQGLNAVGSLGLAYDLAQQAAGGQGRFQSSLLGPTVGMAESIIGGIGGGLRGEVGPPVRAFVDLPGIGQALDLSSGLKQTGSAAGVDLDFLPTRKEIKDSVAKKKQNNPYDYYKNIYKNDY